MRVSRKLEDRTTLTDSRIQTSMMPYKRAVKATDLLEAMPEDVLVEVNGVLPSDNVRESRAGFAFLLLAWGHFESRVKSIGGWMVLRVARQREKRRLVAGLGGPGDELRTNVPGVS